MQETIKWHLERRPIAKLRPHPRNPRQLTKKQAKDLQDSIEQCGLIDKPCITLDGLILSGHQRIAILKQKKVKEVDCWVPNRDLTDEEVDKINIRMNKNTGEWDWDLLANEWNIDKLVEWGFEIKDFHDEDKGTPEKKPAVTIEFDEAEHLDQAMDILKEIQQTYLAKLKIRK